MATTTLVSEIESLPPVLQREVADFVSFLKFRYFPEVESEEDDVHLSEEEWAELDAEFAKCEANPDAAYTWEDIKNELNQQRHAVQNSIR